MELDPVLLSRLQFAFTISFHILFPAFTIGLAGALKLNPRGGFDKEFFNHTVSAARVMADGCNLPPECLDATKGSSRPETTPGCTGSR